MTSHENSVGSGLTGGLPATRSRARTAAFVLVVLSGASLLVLGLGELLVRLVRPQQTYSSLLLLTGEQYIAGDFIPFTLKPNYTARMPSQEHPGTLVTVSTNSFGMRSPPVPLSKPPGVYRILVLGDSYTFGVYVENEESYPAILQERLRASGKRVEVLNAGYADGWSPDEHYAWLTQRGLAFEPDLVIYGFFIGNDIDGYGVLERVPLWSELDARGLPRRVTSPDVYVDAVGRIRSRKADEKTVGSERIYGVPLLRESHLFILLTRLGEPLMQRLGLLEPRGAQGWGVRPFPFILEPASDETMLEQEALFKKLVQGLADTCRERDIRFLTMMIPVNFQVEPSLLEKVLPNSAAKIRRDFFAELTPWLTERSIEFFNLMESMKLGGGAYFPRNGEVHFNPAGNRFAAEQLHQILLPTIPPASLLPLQPAATPQP